MCLASPFQHVLEIHLYCLCTSSLSLIWICQNIFIHSPVYGHLDYFQFSMILNKAVMKILTWCFSGPMFLFLLDKYIETQMLGHRANIMFNALRNSKQLSKWCYTILYWGINERVPVVLYSCQRLAFVILAIPVDLKCYLTVV